MLYDDNVAEHQQLGMPRQRPLPTVPSLSATHNPIVPQQDKQRPVMMKRSITDFDRNATFQYNTRVMIVLALSILPFLSLTGKYSLALLATGLKLIYVLDFLGYKMQSFVGFWVTLSLFWCSVYVSCFPLLWISFWNVFVLFQGSLFVITVGAWGSLNFSYLREFSPEVTLICERCVMGLTPVITLPLLMTLVIGLNGIQNAPFYLAILMCFMKHAFTSPLQSSFIRQSPLKRHIIQGHKETQIYSFLTLILPELFYVVIYHRVLTISFDHLINMWSLVAIPLFFLSLQPQRYLWWWYDNGRKFHKASSIRVVGSAIALSLMVAWLEYRVIFRRYPYILAISAPWNYIVVTFGLYSFIGIALFVLRGKITKTGKIVSVFLCVFSAACGSLAVGLPIWVSPLPAAAAYFGTAFYFTRSWEQFVAFAVSSTLSLLLWLARSFWFLDVEFDLSILPLDWTLNMSHATAVIALFFITCIFVFPAAVKNSSKLLTGVLTIIQAVLLAFLEELLYEQEEGFYSEFLILFTTAVGCLLSMRMFELKRIGINSASILLALYISKIAILASLGVHMTFIATFLTSIAFTRMYFASLIDEKINTTMGWIYFFSSGIALFLTRHVVLAFALQALVDMRFYEITEGHLLGAGLFVWGIALLPLSTKYMKNTIVPKINILVSVIGAIWGLWQPSFEVSLDSGNALFSGNVEWVTWLILITIVFASATALNLANLNHIPAFRAASLVIISVFSSIAFSALYLRYSGIVSILFLTLGFVFAALTEAGTTIRVQESFKYSFGAYVLFIATLPAVYLLVGNNDVIAAQDVTRSARISTLGIYAILNILLSVSIKFKQTKERNDEVALVGNMTAITGYLLSLALITWLSPDNIYAVYLSVACILLLLSKDSQLLKKFDENHRYTLVILIAQISMIIFFVLDLISLFTEFHVVIEKNYAGETVKKDISISWLLVKALSQLVLFFMSAPAQGMNFWFLFTLKRPNVRLILFLCLPLAIISAFLTDSSKFISLYYWAGTSIAGILLQAFVAAQFVKLETLQGLLQ